MSQLSDRPREFTNILCCSLISAIIGLILLIVGAVMTGIAYTEITPPDYDENYNRYLSSNLMRVTGPLCLGFGLLMLFGSCCFFAFFCYRNISETEDSEGFSKSPSSPMYSNKDSTKEPLN